MMKFLPKKSKKGVTLVESVLAVVVLAMFATGILTLLTAGGTKILKISDESAAYVEAGQKMDLVLSAVSNGSDVYIIENASTGILSLDISNLKTTLGLTDVEITAEADLYDSSVAAIKSNVRGWYLEMTYQDATVTGFTSNTQGVFDKA